MGRTSRKSEVDYAAAAKKWAENNKDGRKPTMKDVAALAGVSKKTVSRVINESPLVNEATRKGIQGLIKEIGYRPDPQARGLASRRSYLVGMIYDNPTPQKIDHYQQWTLACLGRGPATACPFDTRSGPLTEAVLLGNVALRYPGKKLEWDGKSLVFPNMPEANRHLQRGYRDRWHAMGEALARHMPESSSTLSRGGTSYWVEGPEALDSDILAQEALVHGIVIEPGSTFFISKKPPRNYFRLGFSAIEIDKIDKGIKILSDLIKEQVEEN